MNFFLVLLVILITARVFAEIAKRLGQPSVAGEILAGIVLGPAFLNFIEPSEVLSVLAGIGIYFLLFLAGMEISTKRLAKVKSAASLTAVGGVFLPFSLGMLASGLMGFGFLESLIISISLSITAIAVSVDTLIDIGKIKTKMASIIVEAGMIDDIIGMVFFSALLVYVGSSSFYTMYYSAIGILVFFPLAILGGLYAVPKILKFGEKMVSRESLFGVTAILLLLYALSSESIGLGGFIGSFFAGIFVRHSVEKRELERKELLEQFSALALGLLTPLFFVWVGMKFVVGAVFSYFSVLCLMVAVAFVGKLAGGGLGAKLSGLKWREGLTVGIGMNGRGGVELVIAEVARRGGIISDQIFSVIVMVSLVATLLTPSLLRFAMKRVHRFNIWKL
jgi:Kef-type K+ transport system membrane component KefB